MKRYCSDSAKSQELYRNTHVKIREPEDASSQDNNTITSKKAAFLNVDAVVADKKTDLFKKNTYSINGIFINIIYIYQSKNLKFYFHFIH